jgi:hypothetical protein
MNRSQSSEPPVRARGELEERSVLAPQVAGSRRDGRRLDGAEAFGQLADELGPPVGDFDGSELEGSVEDALEGAPV